MTNNDNSSEGEVVPCSLANHHDTNHHITDVNNVTPCGGDTIGCDVESDNVSKDNGEDNDYRNKDNNDMDNSDDYWWARQSKNNRNSYLDIVLWLHRINGP